MSVRTGCSCGREWTGAAEAHCRLCHEHFSGASAFDAHKPAYTGCADPATLRRGGMNLLVEKKSPLGLTWMHNPDTPGRGTRTW